MKTIGQGFERFCPVCHFIYISIPLRANGINDDVVGLGTRSECHMQCSDV